jgi:transcriptional regulator with PAS, ATPase and Fis domain
MEPLLRLAWKAARVSDTPLLIEGETGTGKQVLANAIHALDEKRRGRPFVTVHCGTIPDTLFESELFGHCRGAFSGALLDRKGLFPSAHNGTIFLDDVNDLPMALQPKLLDVLQRGRVRAVGSDREAALDVRVIAASNQPLQSLVATGRFRADLYYRLDVIHLRIPPLRERLADLPALALALAARHHAIYGPIDGIDGDLVSCLRARPYSGNVRELEHDVQRMLFAKTAGRTLTLADWEAAGAPPTQSGEDLLGGAASRVVQLMAHRCLGLRDAFSELERRVLHAIVSTSGASRRELAASLKISERSLYEKLGALRLEPPDRV